jgi:transposase InsO family protein
MVCKFLLEDVICRYGCVDKIVADRGELDANEAKEFFARMGIKLSLTTAYNPEANGKIERGHSPIVKALVKACQHKIGEWLRLLPFALWADKTTHSSVTGYMPAELIFG